MKEPENMIVKYKLESYSFLYLELSKDLQDLERTMIISKMALSHSFLLTFITSFKTTIKTFFTKFV